jgi:hypothetical protein
MPKNKSKTSPKKRIAETKAPAKVVKSTPPRNSPVPKTATPRREITHEMIAKRAYEIFLSGRGGDEMHNWLAAERELRAL